MRLPLEDPGKGGARAPEAEVTLFGLTFHKREMRNKNMAYSCSKQIHGCLFQHKKKKKTDSV